MNELGDILDRRSGSASAPTDGIEPLINELGDMLVILAAGRPYRGDKPSLITDTGAKGKVVDWLLRAFERQNVRPHLMLGYLADEIASRYPYLQHTRCMDWERTKSAGTLMRAPLDPRMACYVTYSDILFRKSSIEELAAADQPIAVMTDSVWRHRYEGRSAQDLERCEKVVLAQGRATRLGADLDPQVANAEYVGAAKFSAEAVEALLRLPPDIKEFLSRCNVSTLIEFLRSRGFGVAAVDVQGDWAELNEPEDVARFILGTKAKTLARLRSLVRQSRIEDVFLLTLREWKQEANDVLKRIESRFAGQKLVIRSSALGEDSFTSANAGAFDSVLDVHGEDPEKLISAINTVIASYPDDDPGHQVLVQPMVADVIAAGVVFTRTLTHGSPYRVINYEESPSTDSITSGRSKDHRTVVMHHREMQPPEEAGAAIVPLLPAVKEIEDLLGIDFLDIEFAISARGQVHILQVRPIAVDRNDHRLDDADVDDLLETGRREFRDWQRKPPGIEGEMAVFGVMPDWNPAEIIGTKPGRLAMSLYRFLIMDEVWATQRAEYGYRDVRPEPLLVTFAGHPYVNVRASFNSFIPANVPDELAGRLVDFYIEWLVKNPHLHDKVEFEVLPTCVGLDFERWHSRLRTQGGFTEAEIRLLADSLMEITRSSFDRIRSDFAPIEELKRRLTLARRSEMQPLDCAITLLEDCRRIGTLSFSHLARSAFVAMTILRTAVERGVISEFERDGFLNSIRTVTKMFTEDAASVAEGALEWEALVEKYGHLRPGTYDITSPCYADDPEHFLRPIVNRADSSHASPAVEWTEGTLARLCAAMGAAGLPSDMQIVDRFLRGAIEGRECAKFVFTLNLSEALNMIAEFGKAHGVGREKLAEIDLQELISLRAGTPAMSDYNAWLRTRAAEGTRARRRASMIELPPLLYDESHFYAFMYPSSQPNFIGSGKVTVECVDLEVQHSQANVDFCGRIVLIPQADPGYDWLFGQKIAGLVTKYGGANSHMAIRAAEFGLPAAIGVGDTIYKRLAAAKVLSLDCGNCRLEVVR